MLHIAWYGHHKSSIHVWHCSILVTLGYLKNNHTRCEASLFDISSLEHYQSSPRDHPQISGGRGVRWKNRCSVKWGESYYWLPIQSHVWAANAKMYDWPWMTSRWVFGHVNYHCATNSIKRNRELTFAAASHSFPQWRSQDLVSGGAQPDFALLSSFPPSFCSLTSSLLPFTYPLALPLPCRFPLPSLPSPKFS